MREADIERACVRWAKARGWLAWKFVSPGTTGVPDRVFIKAGRVVFVEVKGPRGVVSTAQGRRIAELRAAGVEAEVVRSVEGLVALLGEK